MESCLFCRIIEGNLPSKTAYEDDQAFAFHDIHPQAPVHLLVVPRKHIPTLNDATTADGPLIGHLFEVARKLAVQFGVDGKGYRTVFNVNADGGQTVFHLHLHVIGGRRLSWP